MLSKPLPAGEKRSKFCKMVLHFLEFENAEVGSTVGVNNTYELLPEEWTKRFVRMLEDLQPSE